MKIYALVLIPAETPEEKRTAAASELLYPHMYDSASPAKEFKFDYMIELDDYDEEQTGQYIWSMDELLQSFEEFEIESIVTPDCEWHDTDRLWDDPEWTEEARALFRKSPNCVGVKFVVHV
jgi:hypothetical protein